MVALVSTLGALGTERGRREAEVLVCELLQRHPDHPHVLLALSKCLTNIRGPTDDVYR